MEEYWLEKAQRAYENAPSIDTWDRVIQEIAALKQRHQWAIEDAQQHLTELDRIVPDMQHKAKNRETYTTRS